MKRLLGRCFVAALSFRSLSISPPPQRFVDALGAITPCVPEQNFASLNEIFASLPPTTMDKIGVGLKEYFESFPDKFIVRSNAGKVEVRQRQQAQQPRAAAAAPSVTTLKPQLVRRNARQRQPSSVAPKASVGAVSGFPQQLHGVLPSVFVPLSAVAAIREQTKEEVLAALATDKRVERLVLPQCGSGPLASPEGEVFVRLRSSVACPERVESAVVAQYRELGNAFPEEYDIYRVARHVPCTEHMPVSELHTLCQNETKLPLMQILLSNPCFNLQISGTEEWKVKFNLDSKFVPREVEERTEEEMSAELEGYEAKKRERREMSNGKRIEELERMRLLKQCITIKKAGLSSLLDPKVLAYLLFDIMGEEPVETGHVPLLLSDEIRDMTNARSKSFLKSFPHLFKLVEQAPVYYLYRADCAPPDTAPMAMDDQELLASVVAVVQERQQTHRKRLFVSAVAMFLPEVVRKQVKKKGGLESFFRAHPELFQIDEGAHNKEMTVTLKQIT